MHSGSIALLYKRHESNICGTCENFSNAIKDVMDTGKNTTFSFQSA